MTICNTRLLNIDMTTLHTFGCSITQGYALPDVVQPILDENGKELTEEQVLKLIHLIGTKFIYINLVIMHGHKSLQINLMFL